ncbi:MAG: sugar transferase, partial [Bryobacteraceae bacterium]
MVLIAVAFQLAYWTRTRLHLEHDFFLQRSVALSLLGWSAVVWLLLGAWWEIYDRIDATHPRVILRDAFRQCLLGAVSVILFQYLWRLDLSRPFVGLFAGWTWFLVCLFRLNAGRLLRIVRREFGGVHYVMVVGLGDAAQRMGRQIEEAATLYAVRLTGFFADDSAEQAPAEVVLGQHYAVHPISTLPDLLKQRVIDEII